jgi:contactin 4
MHVDVGSQLTWRCDARAVPPAAYVWYKNGELLQPITGELDIIANVLIIKVLDADKHSGMYQCAASNDHGTTFSTGQLRVLGMYKSDADEFTLT